MNSKPLRRVIATLLGAAAVLGTAAAPAVAAPPTAPGYPEDFEAVGGDRVINVSWFQPTSDGGSAITKYTVTASPGDETCSTSTELACTLTGVINGQSYSVTLTATNAAGTSKPETYDYVLPQAPATLTATTSATSVVAGGAITVTSTLISDGEPAQGEKVFLNVDYARGGARLNQEVYTGADGKAVFTIRPVGSGKLTLLTLGLSAYRNTFATVGTLSVTHRMSINSNHTAVQTGHPFVISGVVAPDGEGNTVLLQRRTGTHWATIKTAKVAKNGIYKFTVTGTTKGTFAYHAAVPATKIYGASFSADRTVRTA